MEDVQESARLAVLGIVQVHVLDDTLGEFRSADLAVAVGIERRVREHSADLTADSGNLVAQRREVRLQFVYCCASRVVLVDVGLDECLEPLGSGCCVAGNLRGDGDVVAIAAGSRFCLGSVTGFL